MTSEFGGYVNEEKVGAITGILNDLRCRTSFLLICPTSTHWMAMWLCFLIYMMLRGRGLGQVFAYVESHQMPHNSQDRERLSNCPLLSPEIFTFMAVFGCWEPHKNVWWLMHHSDSHQWYDNTTHRLVRSPGGNGLNMSRFTAENSKCSAKSLLTDYILCPEGFNQ